MVIGTYTLFSYFIAFLLHPLWIDRLKTIPEGGQEEMLTALSSCGNLVVNFPTSLGCCSEPLVKNTTINKIYHVVYVPVLNTATN